MSKVKFIILDDNTLIDLGATNEASNMVGSLVNAILSKRGQRVSLDEFFKDHAANCPECAEDAGQPEAPPAAAEAAPAEAVPTITTPFSTFGVNVYESSEHSFALGKKLYANAATAADRKTHNGGWLTSFDLRIQLDTGKVKSEDSDAVPADSRVFAVLKEGFGNVEFSRGYDSGVLARNAHPDALAIVAIAVDDDNNVYVTSL